MAKGFVSDSPTMQHTSIGERTSQQWKCKQHSTRIVWEWEHVHLCLPYVSLVCKHQILVISLKYKRDGWYSLGMEQGNAWCLCLELDAWLMQSHFRIVGGGGGRREEKKCLQGAGSQRVGVLQAGLASLPRFSFTSAPYSLACLCRKQLFLARR